MANVNRKVGNAFERELCETLARNGFWAHNMAQNSAGQPFDVIAARNGKAYPIDCKVCENDVFVLSRIEENQHSSMTLWDRTGNGVGWFALKFSDDSVYMVTEWVLSILARNHKSLDIDDIISVGWILEEWMLACE